MLFGIPEIIQYEKLCTNEYVLAIIKRLWQARSNAAKWNDKVNKLEIENANLRNDINMLKSMYY